MRRALLAVAMAVALALGFASSAAAEEPEPAGQQKQSVEAPAEDSSWMLWTGASALAVLAVAGGVGVLIRRHSV
jgi:hypothetical protein